MASLKRRKLFMYAVFFSVYLLGGIEYAVILPTLWLYLYNTYNAPDYMLGVVLSVYSVASFFASPVFGRICDKTGRSKAIIIWCGCFQVVGSFLYFVGISQWLCVASRFICGIGGSGESVTIAEVSRYTSEKERTGIISKLIAAKQLALLGGPGINLVLRLLHFHIGPFEVNKYTAPGLFMAFMWLILIAVVFIWYEEPFDIFKEEKKEQDLETSDMSDMNSNKQRDLYDDVKQQLDITTSSVKDNGFINNRICSSEFNDDYKQEVMQQCEMSGDKHDKDTRKLIDDSLSISDTSDGMLSSTNFQNSVNDDGLKDDSPRIDDLVAKEGLLGFLYKEYMKDNVIAILNLLFCAMFSQISLEAMCTQVSLEYLDFGEMENSILYCLCGAEILIVYIMVTILSKYVADRNMILCGGVLLLASDLMLLFVLPSAPKHDRSRNLLPMSISIAIDVLSLPFLLVCATSLYSKMTRRETQGLSQGLRYAIAGLGTILAPMWASSVVSKPYLVLGVLVGIQTMAVVLCLLSYKRLKGLELEKSDTIISTPKSTDCEKLSGSDLSNCPANSPDSHSKYGSVDGTDSFACRYSTLKAQEDS